MENKSTDSQQIEPVTDGPFYTDFLAKKRDDGTMLYGPDDQKCIENTVRKLLNPSTELTQPRILLGKIQSGKTKTFLGVMALAFDNGYDIAIVLTKPTRALVKQTYQRITGDFADLIESDQTKVYDILELPNRLADFLLNQKLIFVLKKQSDNLDRLSAALFQTYPQLAKRRVLIVDDEADNASIGYVQDKALGLQLRKIAGQIDKLRQELPTASFLQVTATPYSLYLQPEGAPIPNTALMPVRPKFTELVPVHPAYVGGPFYFEENRTPGSVASFVYKPVDDNELDILRAEDRRRFKVEECLTHDIAAGLRKALVTFITGGCVRRLQDEQAKKRPKRFAFLFHTEASKSAHSWQESVILRFEECLKTEATAQSDLLKRLVEGAYDDLSKSVGAAGQTVPPFSEVWKRVVKAISDGELTTQKVNSEAQLAALLDDEGQLKLQTPLNIFIGGQILDRGITIANLIGFYYGRNPKKFQQDTVLQHSRMYGFRPIEDRAVTRFYTAPHIHRVMQRMHEADAALRERIEDVGDQLVHFIELDDNGQIAPCGNQKILASNITTLRPHRRVLPTGFQTDCKTRLLPITQAIDQLLRKSGPFPKDGETPPPFEVPLELALEIIEMLGPTFVDFAPGYEDRWDADEYKAILQHLSDKSLDQSQRGKVFLLLRTGRNLSRTTPTADFADNPDTSQREGAMARAVAINIPVLMLIRQNGTEAQGWKDCPFWWPVILTPANARTTLFASRR
jgi:hypothetical protein